MAEESKHDIFLRRAQISLAIVATLITIIIGIYNLRKNIFSKGESAPTPPPAPVESRTPRGSKIESALEDVGASWLQSLKKSKTDNNSGS